MHELAVAESVVAAVTERTGTAPVRTVRLQIGQLAGVSTDALRFCFPLAAEDTPLAGAALDIDEPAALAHCAGCGVDFAVADGVLLCRCGSAAVEVVAGRELRIVAVEMAS